MKPKLRVKVKEFQEKDSLSEVMHLLVNINKYSPLEGGLSTYVDMPRDIKLKKAVLNIENNYAYCFLWSVVAAIAPKPKGNPTRKTSYTHYSRVLNFERLEFPMRLSNVGKFEP